MAIPARACRSRSVWPRSVRRASTRRPRAGPRSRERPALADVLYRGRDRLERCRDARGVRDGAPASRRAVGGGAARRTLSALLGLALSRYRGGGVGRAILRASSSRNAAGICAPSVSARATLSHAAAYLPAPA